MDVAGIEKILEQHFRATEPHGADVGDATHIRVLTKPLEHGRATDLSDVSPPLRSGHEMV